MVVDVEKKLTQIEMKLDKLFELVEDRFLTLDEVERLMEADELVRMGKLKKLVSLDELMS